jgi:hypothetical protein
LPSVPIRKKARKGRSVAKLRALFETHSPGEEYDPSEEPIVTYILHKSVAGGIDAVIESLRFSDDEDARSFLRAYDSLTDLEKLATPVEDIAYACGIGSLRLTEVAQTAMFLSGQLQYKLLMASAMPKVVRKSLEMAQTSKGLHDREMMLKSGGILPTPKGTQIAIQNVHESAEGESPTRVWMSADDRLRRIHEVTGQKRLPSPESKPVSQGGIIDHIQERVIEKVQR